MKVLDKTFLLKDGRTFILRSPLECDIQGILDYLYETAKETEFLLRYPEECSKYTYEGEKAFIDHCNESSNETMLIALIDDKVIGVCNVSWPMGIKTRHRATVAIAILKQYWGLGMGTILMNELERIARENDNILQMELEFIEGNTRARFLYEKLGYRITGLRPNAIRLKDGTLLNEYQMVKVLDR